jgi:serine/threonine-protein kinase
VGDLVSGKYRLIRFLGEGGMGTVWLAGNEALGSVVALKVLRDDVDVPDQDARFEREARAAAFIEHPAIVRVLDFGRAENGRPFIVMQYLEGESLLELLSRLGPLPPDEAVRLLLPIVDALSHAHEKGVVHRDLKPDNIFLAREHGKLCPKLLDFGIAKVPKAHSPANITRRGMVLGTVAYMAPEQARGLSDVDHRSDIWALCIVLYEAISGELPFKGDSFHATLRSICDDEAPPLNKAPSDDRLWSILRHGIAKDRRERCPSMRELGDALASWLRTRGVDDDATGARLVQTWGGRDGAFANGPMEAPAWTNTAPVLPLVGAKAPPSYAPSALSTTEVVAIRRRPLPVSAVLAGALIVGLGILAWAVGGSPRGVLDYARTVAAEHLRPEPGASQAVVPVDALPLETLPMSGEAPRLPGAPAPSRNAGLPSLRPAESMPREGRTAAKAGVHSAPATRASSSVAVILLEEEESSGGWIRRALSPEPTAPKARARASE